MKLSACVFVALLVAQIDSNGDNEAKFDGLYRLIERFANQCNDTEDAAKCFKIQGIKVLDNAAKANRIDLFDGVSILKSGDERAGRNYLPLPKDANLHRQSANRIDFVLWQKLHDFVNGHKLQLKLWPLIEEARRKKGRRYVWPLVIALAVKGVLMMMSYQSVAVMSGAALILGKIAILLSAILGLKKLVSSAQDRTTTLEIVKHPQHSHSHVFTTSHEDDYYHHRNYLVDGDVDEADPHKKAYSAYYAK